MTSEDKYFYTISWEDVPSFQEKKITCFGLSSFNKIVRLLDGKYRDKEEEEYIKEILKLVDENYSVTIF